MSLRLFGVAAGLAVTFTITLAARATEVTVPPRGFVALFNGKDLTGWHGMPHFDFLREIPADEANTILFAGHNDPVTFRNVSIKPLD